LLPILTWCLKEHTTQPIIEEQWADFSRIPRQRDLEARFRVTLDLYPCDILFVHRDAENQPPEWRRREIQDAAARISVRYVPVVPVRMTESWLLFDESAIRSAAGNPQGTQELNLPGMASVEDIPDPKAKLYQTLILASSHNAPRRHGFPVRQRVHLIPNYIDGYSPLGNLTAFRLLRQDIRKALGTEPTL